MAQALLDWTFAEIPDDDAPAGTLAIVTRIQTPARPTRARAEAGRALLRVHPSTRARVALLLAGLVAALGVMVLGAAQAGWWRIEQQVTEAVLYEDAQARAGQVNAVLAVQVPSDAAWLAQRKQEVRLGQPGPNPAPQLRLSAQPPEVTWLTATFANEVQASVVRTYADAAGREYRFEFTQTYNSKQIGVWLRQPPDTAPLAATTTWTGARLVATYPLADQTWMSDTLPAVEAALAAACADWSCPPGVRVPLVLASSAASTLAPLPALGAADEPVVFEIAAATPSLAALWTLPSPHLAGLPRDAASRQALAHSIIARSLLAMANQMAGSGVSTQAAVALAARAEARLGLAVIGP